MVAMMNDVLRVIQFFNFEFRCLQLLHLYMLYSTVVVSSLIGQGVFADPRRPNITPAVDQFIPINSVDDVIYNCSAANPGHTVFWEITGTQIVSDTQFSKASELGISIQPMHANSHTSTISISEMARENFTKLSIQCLSQLPSTLGASRSENVYVRTFEAPMAPRNLRLNQAPDGSLILAWDRPTNIPDEVKIEYIITVRSMEESEISFEETFNTSVLFHSINTDELVNSTVCQQFLFTIQGRNLAGTGRTSTPIIDTVPISPDVRNISNKLNVDSVALEPLTIDISFPHVTSCSLNLTLQNYTIEIDNEVALVVSYSEAYSLIGQDNRIRLRLNNTDIPAGVGLDSSHRFTVTVCHDVVCKTSTPQTFNTTGVQRVEAIFFENWLYSYCSYANNTPTSGCLIKLLLRDSNVTEDFEISRAVGNSCNTTNNRLEAYSDLTVVDIETSGMEGNFSLSISAREVYSLDEFINITGCNLDRDPVTSLRVEPNIIVPVTTSVSAAVIVALIIAGIISAIAIFKCVKRNNVQITYTKNDQFEVKGVEETDSNVQTDSSCVSPKSGEILLEYVLEGKNLTLKLRSVIEKGKISIASSRLNVTIE